VGGGGGGGAGRDGWDTHPSDEIVDPPGPGWPVTLGGMMRSAEPWISMIGIGTVGSLPNPSSGLAATGTMAANRSAIRDCAS
jgi:hypothetical protein